MPILLDPEENETRALLDFTGNLSGKHVLEIGCGDGRLAWRYAHLANHVVAIDPDQHKIARARAALHPGREHSALFGRLVFHAATLEAFAEPPPDKTHPAGFDLALLAWSL
jgi:predicted RNA methylase